VDRQTLVFDADDTLWENNVLFERVVESYLDWLTRYPRTCSPWSASPSSSTTSEPIPPSGHGFTAAVAVTIEQAAPADRG
jgi:putative hydrolase of the HAD superfamily